MFFVVKSNQANFEVFNELSYPPFYLNFGFIQIPIYSETVDSLNTTNFLLYEFSQIFRGLVSGVQWP